MNEPSKRSTIYFEPRLHQALRLKAAQSNRSISELVNDAVRASFSLSSSPSSPSRFKRSGSKTFETPN